MKWESGLMEYNISGDLDLFYVKVEQFVGFLAKRVPNKHIW